MEQTTTEPTEVELAIAAGNALKARCAALEHRILDQEASIAAIIDEIADIHQRDDLIVEALNDMEHEAHLSLSRVEVRDAVAALIHEYNRRQDGEANRQGSNDGNTE